MPDVDENLAQRLAAVRGAIDAAALAAGRDPHEVTLVAVSKGHPAAAIREAYALGQRDFGENYVQEWQQKAAELADLAELRWHFIGHLQRNKVKLVVGKVFLLHTADDMQGIDEMARHAWGQSVRQDVLLQVNLGAEVQKRGCTEDDAELFADVLLRSPGLRLCGLMTLPPVQDDPDAVRPYFARLHSLGDRLRTLVADQRGQAQGWPWHLSMGMSGDFGVAIAQGATHVRVGTAIFGSRTP